MHPGEVRGVDGQWINADPVMETVLVNVGHLNVEYQGINVVVVDICFCIYLWMFSITFKSRLYYLSSISYFWYLYLFPNKKT